MSANAPLFLEGRSTVQVPSVALSIRQPWAWCCAHGYKGFENRTWGTRWRGRFLIHAGRTFDLDGWEWIRMRFPDLALPPRGGFDLGGYVGIATLADVFRPERHPPENRDVWRDYAQFGHFLALAKAIPFTPDAGQLGYYTVSEAARLAVSARSRDA